jgi:hypothetical protein
MSAPDKPKNDTPAKATWTDGGPTGGGPGDKSFAYRQSRKAFIAACEKAGADVISRVHPARAPDGGPLFLDSAAFGPRLAQKGVLVVAEGAGGAAVMQALLNDKVAARLPKGLRLVLVHGGDPAGFAWNDPGRGDAAWGAAMLEAVRTEDLRQAGHVTLVRLGDGAPRLAAAGVAVRDVTLAANGAAKKAVEQAITAAGAA